IRTFVSYSGGRKNLGSNFLIASTDQHWPVAAGRSVSQSTFLRRSSRCRWSIPASISVQPVLTTRQENALPECLASKDDFIGRRRRARFQKRKTECLAAIFQRRIVY